MGDIVEMDSDGYFKVVDRIKDMINVSGNKVYSRVIDDILHEHEAVDIAGVIGVPDPERPGSERVKAFVQLKPGYKGKVSEKDIIDFLKGKVKVAPPNLNSIERVRRIFDRIEELEEMDHGGLEDSKKPHPGEELEEKSGDEVITKADQ